MKPHAEKRRASLAATQISDTYKGWGKRMRFYPKGKNPPEYRYHGFDLCSGIILSQDSAENNLFSE